MKRPLLLLVPLALLAPTLAACGSSSSGSGSSGSSSKVTITVDAAASLTGAFTTLGKQFEQAHSNVTVKFNFGPSSGLSEQIQQGAPVDVFASAATSNMDDVVKAGDAKSPENFVSNTLEIAVPPKNPAGITGLNDLTKKGVKVVVCQAQVPCGVVAAQVFKNAKIKVKPVSEEADVKSVLTKVTTGEADAGLVYVTDVKSAGDQVKGVTIPASVNTSTTYPIAVLSGSKHASTAKQFVALVQSAAGQKVLAAAGFAPPPSS